MTLIKAAADPSRELKPCPLCRSANVALGICYVEFRPNMPAVRCCDCGCRATLEAWNTRAAPAGNDGVRRYVVRKENSDNLCGMTAWGECWSVIDAPDGPDAVTAKWVGFFIDQTSAETVAAALALPQPREALAAEIKRAAAAPPITNPLVLPAGIKAGDYASPSPIPEAPVGWALVPLEPTQEMIAAAEDARFAYAGYCYRDAYREMVNAARALKPQDGGNCEHGITKVNCGICVPSEVFSKPQDGGESGR